VLGARGDRVCEGDHRVRLRDGPTPSGTTTIKLPASLSQYFVEAMGELDLTGVFGPVVIEGSGIGPLGTTIDAAHNDRVLLVEQGANVSNSGLTITGASPGRAAVRQAGRAAQAPAVGGSRTRAR
jgi:hypothetical protein